VKLCIDLCSGLGGFSQAFKDNPEWEVVRIDIERKFKPDVCADVRFLPLKPGLSPELLLMSPPCERFSLAAFGAGNTKFPGKGIRLALEIVGACLEFVNESKAKFWLMENPRGRLRYFIGKPPNTVDYRNYGGKRSKPTDLWGNVPFSLLLSDKRQKIDWLKLAKESPLFSDYLDLPEIERAYWRHRSWEVDTHGSAPERARIPYGLSQAILEAVSQ
jgi:hypothetical protein